MRAAVAAVAAVRAAATAEATAEAARVEEMTAVDVKMVAAT